MNRKLMYILCANIVLGVAWAQVPPQQPPESVAQAPIVPMDHLTPVAEEVRIKKANFINALMADGVRFGSAASSTGGGLTSSSMKAHDYHIATALHRTLLTYQAQRVGLVRRGATAASQQVKAVNMALGMFSLDNTVAVQTSIWGDTDIRDAWDTAKSILWFVAFSGLIVAMPLVISAAFGALVTPAVMQYLDVTAGQPGINAAVISVAGLGLGALLLSGGGIALGVSGVTGGIAMIRQLIHDINIDSVQQRVREKLEFVELSRQAYDQLVAAGQTSAKYLVQNEERVRRLDALVARFDSCRGVSVSETEDLLRLSLAERDKQFECADAMRRQLTNELDGLPHVIEQIPGIIGQFENIEKRYRGSVDRQDAIVRNMCAASAGIVDGVVAQLKNQNVEQKIEDLYKKCGPEDGAGQRIVSVRAIFDSINQATAAANKHYQIWRNSQQSAAEIRVSLDWDYNQLVGGILTNYCQGLPRDQRAAAKCDEIAPAVDRAR